MSSSQLGATNVVYEASFDVATTGTVQGVVVDVCQESPIIGDVCTSPTGFDFNEATVDVVVTGLNGAGSFTLDAASDTNTAVLTNATAGSTAAATPVTITFGTAGVFPAANTNGVTNPTDNNTVDAGNQPGTFYARIITYTTVAGATAYDSTTANVNNPGAEPPVIDAGGVALSTAQQITITSKVQERLVFCVYANDATGYANNDCTDKGSTGAITLGDDNGVLDPAGPFVDKYARYSITTNASGNAVIRAKGTTLTSGSFTVSPVGAGTAKAPATTPGTEQFGFCTFQLAGTGLAIDTDYDGDDGAGAADDCSTTTQSSGTGTPGGTGANGDSQFAFITAELNSTFGSPIATKTAGTYSTGELAFLGNIDNTTEAGIYTTVLTFIATGTY